MLHVLPVTVVALSCAVVCAAHAYRSSSSSSLSSASTFSFGIQRSSTNQPPSWSYPYPHQHHQSSQHQHGAGAPPVKGFPRPGTPGNTAWSLPPHGSQNNGPPPRGSGPPPRGSGPPPRGPQDTENRIGSGSSSSQPPKRNSVNAGPQCQEGGKMFNVGDKWTPKGGCARRTCAEGGKTATLGCPSLEVTKLCSLTPEDSRQPWPLCCPQLKCSE